MLQKPFHAVNWDPDIRLDEHFIHDPNYEQEFLSFLSPILLESTTILTGTNSDIFSLDIPDSTIDCLFSTMSLTYEAKYGAEYKQRHNYYLLTRYPARLQTYLNTLRNLSWDALFNRFYAIALHSMDILSGYCNHEHLHASLKIASWVKDDFPGLYCGLIAHTQRELEYGIGELFLANKGSFIAVMPTEEMKLPEIIVPRPLANQYHRVPAVNAVFSFFNSGKCSSYVRQIRIQCNTSQIPFFEIIEAPSGLIVFTPKVVSDEPVSSDFLQ